MAFRQLAAVAVVALLVIGALAIQRNGDDDAPDRTPPQIAVLNLANGTQLTGSMQVQVDVHDGGGVREIAFLVDNEPRQVGGLDYFVWDTTAETNGLHLLAVRATDRAGNTGFLSVPVVLFNNLAAPTCAFDAAVDPAPRTDTFALSGTAADAEGALAGVTFALDDGEWLPARDLSGDWSRWEVTFDPAAQTPGIRTLRVRVDDGDRLSEPCTVQLDLNHAPIAVITAPDDDALVQEGELVLLDAGDSHDDEPLTYRWSSDLDGPLYEGTEAMTVTLAPGIHQLTLTTDDGRGGLAVVTVEVEVNAAPHAWLTPPDDFVRGEVLLTGGAADSDDELAVVELSLDGGDWQAAYGLESWEFELDTTTLADGLHTLRIRAGDSRDGVAETEPLNLTIDNTSPAMAWVGPAENATLSGWHQVQVQALDSVAGIASVTLRLDAAVVAEDDAWLWNTSTAADGEHLLTAEALDAAGNRAELAARTVITDNHPPALTWLAPVSEYLGGNVTLEVEAEDDGSGLDYIAFAIADEEVQNGSAVAYDWDTTTVADGPGYLLEAWVADNLGHTSRVNRTVMVDNTAPVPDIIAPADGVNTTGAIEVRATAVENGSGVVRYVFFLDDIEVQNGSAFRWDWDSLAASEGRHDLRVACRDRAGNRGTDEIMVYLDHTPPSVSDLTPADGSDLDDEQTARLTATDGGSGMERVEFYLDAALTHTDNAAPWEWSFDTGDYSDGNHTLTAWAYDRAGNRADLTARWFFGDVEQPVVTDPGTDYLQPYDIDGVARITLPANMYAAAPYLASVVPRGVTPSLGWNGDENPKTTLEPSETDVAELSGRLALSYWDAPDRAIVVDSYEHALLMAPLAGLADIPLLLYDWRYTDEALTKLGTIYAPQIIVCGDTPYNNRGVTVLDDDEVLGYTLDYALYIGHDVEYIVATNPNDGSGIATTPHLSALAGAWAVHHGGVLVVVPASASEINSRVHAAYTALEAVGMTPRFLNIVGDEKSVPMLVQGSTPSDNSYADRDGNRYTVEVANGRVLAKELWDQSYYLDRIVNYDDYLDIGLLRANRVIDSQHWSNNAVIYMGWAAEFAEDSENHCRERMWAEGQFNTQDDTDKAHAGMKPAMMEDFARSNFIIINADHGMPSGTVTWSSSDLLDLNPAVFFGVSCSVGRIDGVPKSTSLTYTVLEKGSNNWLAPTRTAYGSFVQTYPYQPIAAPGLCYLYLILMINNDLTSGEAYQQAKNELIANGIGGDVDQVTTWQYQHYGDPAFNPYEPSNEGM